MAFKHKVLYRIWGKKLLAYRDDFLNAHFPEKTGRIRVLHIVKWFYAGGAERLLSSLLKYSDRGRYEHIILSLSSQNERLGTIHDTLNIPYYAIEIPREGNNLRHYLKCLRFIGRAKPDIIKTWLPSCNIPGGIMGNILRVPVIWGVHDAQPPKYKNAIRQIYLSGIIPKRIVCCSEPVRAICLKTGFRASKLEVIVNGTDTEAFHYQAEGRKRVRNELGIGDDTILIGMAAEYIPIKRHMHFLLAARILIESYSGAHFLFCGKNTNPDNPALTNAIEFLGLQKHLHLLGIRDDMADIYSALDIHTLNSTVESFGLAVTEAMACKTLCVATNVGMMKYLLKDVGEIIPSSAPPSALAEAWKRLLQLSEQEKSERREKGRKRIKEQYSIAETAKRYDALYHSVHSQHTSDADT